MGIRNGNRRNVLFAVACHALAMRAAGQTPPERFPMPVVVYDDAGVSPTALEPARQIVSGLFGHIGVDAVWLTVEEFTRQMPREPAGRRAFVAAVLQIKLVTPAMHQKLRLKTRALGTAIAATRSAWISVENVRASAQQSGVELSDALGCVIAHEIGHLLLPPGSHSGTGLMGEYLEPQNILHNRLSFLPEEAMLIRATLSARRTTVTAR
jgi:hypothetical protein